MVNDELFRSLLPKIKRILEKEWDNTLNRPHLGGVFEIPSQSELEQLIRSGSKTGHIPGTPREAHYNAQYLREKKQITGSGPHVYRNFGFLDGTKIRIKGRSVQIVFDTTKTYDAKYNFNYGVLHEMKKSPLKATMLFAWNPILNELQDEIINRLK